MARVLRNKLNKEIEDILWRELFREIKKINSTIDLKKFFNRFFTKDEEILILRRLALMRLISDKKKYREIKNILDVSSNTISAVKDIMMGYGYGKRDKKIKYSPGPKSQTGNKSFSRYPTMVGKGRWRFLNM